MFDRRHFNDDSHARYVRAQYIAAAHWALAEVRKLRTEGVAGNKHLIRCHAAWLTSAGHTRRTAAEISAYLATIN